jgi:hypothetical protein
MFIRPILALASLCAPVAFSQDLKTMVPGFDASRLLFAQSGDMDFDIGGGSVAVTDVSLRSFLCQPISPSEGLYLIPEAGYRFTDLRFDGATAPMQDEDLHSLFLSGYLISMKDNCPWIWGGWTRAELASDFQDVDGDDFTFDVAGGVGYRFSDTFTLGVGAALLNLGGDEAFYPGIGFDWIVNEQLRVGFYGPVGMAAYSINDDWLLSARFDFSGGVWNINDPAGNSRSIDMSDNRLGIYASRRLTENLWLTAGVGVTIANEINYTSSSGNTTWFQSDLDTAPFGVISLRVKAW